MQPDFDLRLRTMSKALAQVVIPAIDKQNRMALEQAQLVLGSMEVLRQQVDYAQWFEVADLLSLCNLAEALRSVEGLAVGTQLPEARREGMALTARQDVSLQQMRSASAALREAISGVVESAFSLDANQVLSAVSSLVMAHAQEEIARERAFVAAMKWDGYPETLLGIEASLKKVAPHPGGADL